MYKLLIVCLLLISCNEKEDREDLALNISERALSLTLTDGKRVTSNNVSFTEMGARLSYTKSPSYIKIDSLNIDPKKGFNLSCWFKLTGEDATKEQMLFSIYDNSNSQKSITFWIAGRRLTERINSSSLWANDYNYKKGASTTYYDLFELELGKYYFLSVNITTEEVQVFINSELYANYTEIGDSQLSYDELFMGVAKDIEGNYEYQYDGFIRNLTIFNKALNEREIDALSKETYSEIFPYNDAFELSKFNIEH